jgi:uncharacterized membrane protein
MALFRATNKLDRAFEIGLLFKAIDGLIETISGIIFLFIKPETITRIVHSLTAHRLSHNPHDFVATHIVNWARDFTKGAAIFAALYLLAHGVIKLILVVEILREHLWAYAGLIVVTSGFIVYQVIEIIIKPRFSFIALTIFDVFIVWLTVIEYGRQREHFAHKHKKAESAPTAED